MSWINIGIWVGLVFWEMINMEVSIGFALL